MRMGLWPDTHSLRLFAVNPKSDLNSMCVNVVRRWFSMWFSTDISFAKLRSVNHFDGFPLD